MIRCPRETFNARGISHANSHAGYGRARASERTSCVRPRARVRRSREKKVKGERSERGGEPSGEHVRSFRDSCFEFATRRATACRKGGKKIACRRATRRVGCGHPPVPPATQHHPLSWRTRETAVRSVGEKKREMSVGGGKIKARTRGETRMTKGA